MQIKPTSSPHLILQDASLLSALGLLLVASASLLVASASLLSAPAFLLILYSPQSACCWTSMDGDSQSWLYNSAGTPAAYRTAAALGLYRTPLAQMPGTGVLKYIPIIGSAINRKQDAAATADAQLNENKAATHRSGQRQFSQRWKINTGITPRNRLEIVPHATSAQKRGVAVRQAGGEAGVLASCRPRPQERTCGFCLLYKVQG
jgi:hypothetical protein